MPDTTIVMLPGWMGSGPEHWQTIWEAEHPDYRRAEMRNWQSTHLADWVECLDTALAAVPGDALLVAHSLGCLAVVWWVARHAHRTSPVRGAMLVAPPCLTSAPGLLPALASFAPVPSAPLPFPSLVVASENDPYARFEEAVGMASAWGSELRNIGRAGHINTASGHGAWPEGKQLLAGFVASARESVHR
jgi:predicted alpha/beta hydrolase family esterase